MKHLKTAIETVEAAHNEKFGTGLSDGYINSVRAYHHKTQTIIVSIMHIRVPGTYMEATYKLNCDGTQIIDTDEFEWILEKGGRR